MTLKSCFGMVEVDLDLPEDSIILKNCQIDDRTERKWDSFWVEEGPRQTTTTKNPKVKAVQREVGRSCENLERPGGREETRADWPNWLGYRLRLDWITSTSPVRRWFWRFLGFWKNEKSFSLLFLLLVGPNCLMKNLGSFSFRCPSNIGLSNENAEGKLRHSLQINRRSCAKIWGEDSIQRATATGNE